MKIVYVFIDPYAVTGAEKDYHQAAITGIMWFLEHFFFNCVHARYVWPRNSIFVFHFSFSQNRLCHCEHMIRNHWGQQLPRNIYDFPFGFIIYR